MTTMGIPRLMQVQRRSTKGSRDNPRQARTGNGRQLFLPLEARARESGDFWREGQTCSNRHHPERSRTWRTCLRGPDYTLWAGARRPNKDCHSPSRKAAARLDEERSWIDISEYNAFVWPGPDLRPTRTSRGAQGQQTCLYGFLPRKFFAKIRLALNEYRLSNKPRLTRR
jgi:hypothetical protein